MVPLSQGSSAFNCSWGWVKNPNLNSALLFGISRAQHRADVHIVKAADL